MMSRLLLSATFLTIAGLVVTIFAGFGARTTPEVSAHVLLGLITALIGLFSQSMTIFYFIGTGREIREEAGGRPDEHDLLRETKLFKKRVFPTAVWAIAAIITTFVLGGGVYTGRFPIWLHVTLAAITLLLFIRAYWLEFRAMSRNAILREKVRTSRR